MLVTDYYLIKELRRSLYALFSSYGKVIDVVHTRDPKVRGTAFIVFRDLASSTSALRALDGEGFFGKQLVSFNLSLAAKFGLLELELEETKKGDDCTSFLVVLIC